MHIWPTVADLNTRARRLVTHFLKCQKQEEIRLARLQRIKEKREREKEVSRKKMLKRMEQAEKWSKREEQDFSRVITFYGVERIPETSEYDWSKFRSVIPDSQHSYHYRVCYIKGNLLTLLASQMTKSPLTTWTSKVLADVFVTNSNQKEVNVYVCKCVYGFSCTHTYMYVCIIHLLYNHQTQVV